MPATAGSTRYAAAGQSLHDPLVLSLRWELLYPSLLCITTVHCQLHLSALTVSAVMTAVALSSPWVGAWADAVGRKRVIVPAILGLALTTLLAAKEARSSAAGLYVSFYYLGGSAGATVLGLLWRWSGWTACLSLVVAIQLASAVVAMRFFTRGASRSPVSKADTSHEPVGQG